MDKILNFHDIEQIKDTEFIDYDDIEWFVVSEYCKYHIAYLM